ncbi:MAG: hypothetical protein OXI93_19125, partial [Bryobacterales bacterium]|nr:hypothetical protein [Bryobacterales bacterium]
RCACLPCSTYCSSTPARVQRLAPRPDGPLTHFASPHGEQYRLSTHIDTAIRVFVRKTFHDHPPNPPPDQWMPQRDDG